LAKAVSYSCCKSGEKYTRRINTCTIEQFFQIFSFTIAVVVSSGRVTSAIGSCKIIFSFITIFMLKKHVVFTKLLATSVSSSQKESSTLMECKF